MEENSNLQRKLEQAQLQQVMFLTQMMQQNPALGASIANAAGVQPPSLTNMNLGLGFGGVASSPTPTHSSSTATTSGGLSSLLNLNASPSNNNLQSAFNNGFSQNASLI